MRLLAFARALAISSFVLFLAGDGSARSYGRPTTAEVPDQASASFTWEAGCPKPEKLLGVCNDVYQKVKDSDPNSDYSYDYERKIFEASCASFHTDDDAATLAKMRRRVQEMWKAHHDELACSRADFDVPRGSILKYAISQRDYNFIDDATAVWGLDLNFIDKSDGWTILDYIDEKTVANKGNSLEQILVNYHKRLRRYGAKYCAELRSSVKCDISGAARGKDAAFAPVR